MNQSAFPFQEWHGDGGPKQFEKSRGMTLRDYFAAKAMQAMIAHPDSNAEVEASIYARGAYVMADAMMKEREA